jgi:hypothetical protein
MTIEILGAVVTVLGLIVILFQWQDKRIHGRLRAFEREISGDVDGLGRELSQVRHMAEATRAELYREYTTTAQLERLMTAQSDSQTKIHERLSGISRELSRIVGQLDEHFRQSNHQSQPGLGAG